MLVEIPDLNVIFGLVSAFIGGLFTLFVYSRLKADSASNNQIKADSERLEFYERQLIDLKIKLDAIDLENLSFSQEIPQDIVKNEEKSVQVVEKQVQIVPEQVSVSARVERTPNMSSGDIVEAVLRLITDRSHTSRDIQITLGKSREHISRTMKKMSDDGLVKRNTNAKPYSYSITQNGLSKLSEPGSAPQTIAPQTS
ncbi:helix-turn-helix domain-containing protein [Candidatus Nitrosopelagicus sp.]|nr:helix-turn-helix domain-containing protein [Candidatus Nitrosopelagicus sp.]